MKRTVSFVALAVFCTFYYFSQGILVNHTYAGIAQIPESAIVTAKNALHIAYGHTSHGSQLTDGMAGFANGEEYLQTISVYQNPSNGIFSVKASNGFINAVEVCNLLGVKVYTIKRIRTAIVGQN